MKEDKEIAQPEETIPKFPPAIEDKFNLFFELDEKAPFWEQFDNLTNAISAYRIYLLKRHRDTGKKTITAEEVFLFDCMEQHKHLEKLMTSAKKLGRLSPDSVNPNMDKDLLAKVVKMKGTVGAIVQTVPVVKKEIT